ncbi:MAG: PAS domain S-box protein [Syntrophaceae bacterium]|nr:PAS domain S-box protein [Syntrophaceae bacterium]
MPMRAFFIQQLDYIFFCYGLAFFLLAVVVLALNRVDRNRLPWLWLALFGLTHGINEWLDMVALSLGDHEIFLTIRLIILAISFFCLLEFGRRSLSYLQLLHIPTYGTVILTILCGWGFFFGIETLSVSIRYTLAIPAAFCSAYAMLCFQRQSNPQNPALSFAAVILFLYGLATGLIVPKAELYPAILCNQEIFQAFTGLPIQFLRGSLALMLASAMWFFYVRFHDSLNNSNIRKELDLARWIVIVLVAVVFMGWVSTDYIGKQKEKDLRDNLLKRVQLAAVTLDPLEVKSLKWNQVDLKSSAYQNLKKKMILLHQAAPDSRFVCLMGYKDRRTYVLADSEPPESPDYSPPGQYYEEASEDYVLLLEGMHKDLIGPLHDRWGSWITGVCPVIKFDQKIIHLVFDFDAAYWLHEINGTRLIPIVITLMITILIMTFFIMYQHSLDTREALAVSEKTLRRVFDHVYDAVIVHDFEGRIIDANDRTLSLYNIDQNELSGLSIEGDLSSSSNTLSSLPEIWQKVLDGENVLFEWISRRPHDGHEFPVEVHLSRMELAGKPVIVATVRDLTENKRAEKERNLLQEQFLQSQKMESVGRLAGGVAHDFNNMLAAILGYAELTLEYMTPPGAQHRECLLEIQKAGERAKSLTKQLLAFGRKQVLEFKPTNLNQVIRDFEKLLKRLIGEDIEIKTNLSPVLQLITADTSQIEQILLNLAINARDAMPGGGSLTISTGNVQLIDTFNHTHSDVKPGEYVFLTITDTGSGMNEETRIRIFEPFFTTKEKTKGTGLGLSTVYGIVSQHGGYIDVNSKIGEGSSFRILFPASIDPEHAELAAPAAPGKTMIRPLMILVVEDDPAIRLLTCRFLDQMGHKVLEAHDVRNAIRICTEYRNKIDIMLTDVVMPEMTGRQLYDHVRDFSPSMRVIYMSGYPEQVIARHGVLDHGTLFLQKPFSSYDLSRLIRKAFSLS